MAGNVTTQGSVYSPEVLADAVAAGFPGMVALYGTRAAIINTQMPYGRTHLDAKVKIPYFNLIGEMEDVDPDGGELSPAELTGQVEEAVVRHSGKGIEFTAWAQLNPTDPYGEGRRQIVEATRRRADKALIDAALNPTGWSAYTVDRLAYFIDYDSITRGMAQLGDEGLSERPVAMVAHSRTVTDMYEVKDAGGKPMLVEGGPGGLMVIAPLGIPVIVSDKVPVDLNAGTTTSALLWENSLAFWINGNPTIRREENARKDSDGEYVHIYHATHRFLRRNQMSKPGVVHVKHKIKI
jgi:hypothetical protein